MADTPPTGPIQVETFKRTYFKCPHCQYHDFSISALHHLNKTFKTACDMCGTDWNITVGATLEDVTMSVSTTGKYPGTKTVRGYSLLRYRGGGRPQFIVVKDSEYHKSEHDAQEERRYHEYRYDSGTCPTNYLQVEHITFNGDADPHGIYAFVRFISKDDILQQKSWSWEDFANKMHRGDSEFWLELFPEMEQTSEADEPSTFDTFDDADDINRGFTAEEIAEAGESAAKSFDRLKDTVKMFGSPTPLDFSPRLKDYTRKH